MKNIAAYKKAATSNISERDQNEFVEEYAPLVKRIAYHLMTRLPPSV